MDVYATTTIGGVRWWIDPGAMQRWRRVLEPLIADPDGVLRNPGSVARPRAGRKRFYHVRPNPDQPGLFVKVFGRPGGALGWPRRLRSSRARREARIARAIAARGLAVAAPIAVGEHRTVGLLRRSFSVIPEIDARDLRSLLSDPQLAAKTRRELMVRFGSFTRRMHDSGIDQDDTSPNNFLVDANGDFVLIDFERCKVGNALTPARRWRLLAKLERHRLGVSRTDRLRFLRAYLGQSEIGDVRSAWMAIQRSLGSVREHDARRAARGAFQVGRHIERTSDAWLIRGREDLPFIHFALPPREARKLWVLAQQLERLSLPALRPARLTASGVDFLRPADSRGVTQTRDEESDSLRWLRSIERARRELERYGRWKHPPEWEATSTGPVLRDLRAFELRFDDRAARRRSSH